jgi:transposase InsO family protein
MAALYSSHSFWSALTSSLGIKHKLATAYHPQAKGAVEQFHRRLKNGLGARLTGNDWHVHLPWAIVSLRAALHEDSAVSAEELVFRRWTLITSQLVTPAHR